MIFVIPIIVGAVAAGFGALGIAKGAEGFNNIKKAEEIVKLAQKRHEDAVEDLKNQWQETNRLAGSYGNLQLRVRHRIVGRFVEFIRRNGQKASKTEQQLLEGLEGISIPQLEEFKTVAFEAKEVLNLLGKSTGAGCAAGTGAVGLASTVGKVAVPQFFGLFTKQVAVAELGLPGVAVWLGGGNALLGGAVLGGVAVGPALAVGGFKLAGDGEKKLTQAREYQAEVNTQIAEIRVAGDFLRRVETRIREIGILVRKLETLASKQLDELESKDFLPGRDAAAFQQVALLVKALVEISKTPILDNQGNLNPLVINVQAKYKHLGDS